jgi:hypothetical protein
MTQHTTKESYVSHRISLRRAAVSAVLAGSLLVGLVPSMASAATPRAGYYSGPTSQMITSTDPAQPAEAGEVDFKVMKYGSFNGTVRKFLKVGATTQLTCPSGEVKQDYFSVYIIMGGKIDGLGRFKYSYKGFSFKGRFTSRTTAKGTLSRTVGDCKAENVHWTAKRSTGGIPIP